MRLLPLLLAIAITAHAAPPEPKFTHFTLDAKIQIGYGLAVADVDGDGRLDVLLADKRQIVWYQNPGTPPPGAATLVAPIWSKFVIAENLTEKDHVCIAAQDIDGDGKCEVAVGAGWNPGDTEKSGAVFYLIAPADRQERWTPVKFPSVEPTTHRMRWIKLKDEGRRMKDEEKSDPASSSFRLPPSSLPSWGLVVLPLHGRGNKNGEGAPVKVLLYHPPTPLNDPQGEWKSEVIDESLHMTHNFDLLPENNQDAIILGGREGTKILKRTGPARWAEGIGQVPKVAAPHGKPSLTPAESVPGLLVTEAFKGAGEVRAGNRTERSAPKRFTATIEPMHGQSLVIYRRTADDSGDPSRIARMVLTDKLTEGHALACGDLLGVKSDQIVVGWRGSPGKEGSTTGVAMWTPMDDQGEKWRETMIDRDGMACEDLQLADLDGDGDLDIVAAGRATKNVKIYWNETPRS